MDRNHPRPSDGIAQTRFVDRPCRAEHWHRTSTGKSPTSEWRCTSGDIHSYPEPVWRPRHLGVTTQLAGAAADHFVEDRLRRTAVENQPLGTDVVIVELVMRQAAAIEQRVSAGVAGGVGLAFLPGNALSSSRRRHCSSSSRSWRSRMRSVSPGVGAAWTKSGGERHSKTRHNLATDAGRFRRSGGKFLEVMSKASGRGRTFPSTFCTADHK